MDWIEVPGPVFAHRGSIDPQDLGWLSTDHVTPDRLWSAATPERVAYLDRLLLRIPLATGDLLRAHYLEGLSQVELAQMRGVTQGGISLRCTRGRQQMRMVVEEDWPDITPVEAEALARNHVSPGAAQYVRTFLEVWNVGGAMRLAGWPTPTGRGDRAQHFRLAAELGGDLSELMSLVAANWCKSPRYHRPSKGH